MDAKEILYKFQMKRFKTFMTQDHAKGDVTFDFDGKKLYAHKFMLCSISSKFDSMLSEKWIKKNESNITIKDFRFDDFKEFITFIYSGQCQLTEGNIMNMVAIAESYGIEEFKEECEKFLITIEPNLDNICRMVELASKYTIKQFKHSINEFVSNNFLAFLKLEQFKSLQKSTITEIVKSNQRTSKREELFSAVYKWAENRVVKLNANPQNMNDAIKAELSGMLPFIKFEKMKCDFFIEHIVRKSFFSSDELCNILLARKKVYVKVIDENEKEMEGELQCPEMEKTAAVIQLLQNTCCLCDSSTSVYYWKTNQLPLSKECILKRNRDIEWYLVYDSYGDLAIKQRSQLQYNNYFLAELFAENGFKLSTNCKIEICRFV